MVRRRPTARKSFAHRRVRRIQKYDHHVVPRRFKIYLPDMSDLLKDKLEPHVECEEPTMLELESKGVPQNEWQYYLGFMKRMLDLYRTFIGETLQQEKDSLIAEYVLRGKDKEVLEQVQEVARNCAGIAPPPPPPPLIGYLYAGTDTIPGKILKARCSDFTRVDAITLNPGEDSVRGLAISGDYLYASTNVSPSIIVKVDLTTFTRAAALTLNPGENIVQEILVSGDYLYALTYTNPCRIVKISLSTFTRVGAITLNPGESWPLHGEVVGNYLYVACDEEVVRVDLTTFTRVGAITLDPDEYWLYDIEYKDPYLYVSTWDSGTNKIVRITESTFTRDSALTLASNLWPDTLLVDGDYIYVGCDSGQVLKVDLATFTVVGSVTPAAGAAVEGLAASEGYLYAGVYSVDGAIEKIKESPYSFVSQLTFLAGEQFIMCLVFSTL